MQQRRGISIGLLIVLGIIVGYFLKNVKIGLIIGLGIGLLSGSLLRGRK